MTCPHECIGRAADGSGVIVCLDCDEQFVASGELAEKLDEMTSGHKPDASEFDEGYAFAARELRAHFLGA